MGAGVSVGSDVAVGVRAGVGDGEITGTGMGVLGRTTKLAASATMRISVLLLYFPTAKIFLPTSLARSIDGGTSRVMAWEEVVER
jgi:hypothetical protein